MVIQQRMLGPLNSPTTAPGPDNLELPQFGALKPAFVHPDAHSFILWNVFGGIVLLYGLGLIVLVLHQKTNTVADARVLRPRTGTIEKFSSSNVFKKTLCTFFFCGEIIKDGSAYLPILFIETSPAAHRVRSSSRSGNSSFRSSKHGSRSKM